ncbi:hypothetical protein TNCV_925651 [Trichonephila clavipes]|nr:hypothetical protein TNCV_925651 [Trichonephila clavipes]
MPRRKQRSAFDQVSEFDRGRIVTYRDYRLPFRTTDVSTANGALKEGCGRQNGVKLSLLTSDASVCNNTMAGFESGGTVERGC